MSRFRDLLRRTNERLDMPQPEKSRILLEIAADLEDAFELYRSEGLDEEEAARRAEEKFEVSEEALRELVEIHQSAFRRFLGRISGQAQTRWERVLLVAVVVCIAAFAGREFLSAEPFRRAGSFVWAVAGTALAAFVLTVIKAYTIYIRRERDVRKLRKGLQWLPVLGGLSLAAGLVWFVLTNRVREIEVAEAAWLLDR